MYYLLIKGMEVFLYPKKYTSKMKEWQEFGKK